MRPDPSPSRTPPWKDALLLAAELVGKQVYWRLPRTARLARRLVARPAPGAQVADRQELRRHLEGIGITEGALVMAHTSSLNLVLTAGPEATPIAPNALAVAGMLVDDLLGLLGATGTLVMPTHAVYQGEHRYGLDARSRPPIEYDPARTPGNVGLANELFRRRKDVRRSLYPFNMVAAHGPLAEELLRDNLNDSRPLPHGKDSPYYRICQRDGLVVSIGVPLGECMTLVHAAEDVRDEEWPVKGFFEERSYKVRIDGADRLVVVRHQRPEYSMFCRCRHKNIRDLVGAGIIHQGQVGTVRVDWARAREVFDYAMARNRTKPYPFYCTWLVRSRR